MNNLEKRQQAFAKVEEACCHTPDVEGIGNVAVSNFIINAWSNSHMDKDMKKAEEARLSYVSHLDSIKELLALDDHDEQFEMVEGMVLSIEQSRVYDLCFGTGGPAYHLIIRTNHHLHNQEIIMTGFTRKYFLLYTGQMNGIIGKSLYCRSLIRT